MEEGALDGATVREKGGGGGDTLLRLHRQVNLDRSAVAFFFFKNVKHMHAFTQPTPST